MRSNLILAICALCLSHTVFAAETNTATPYIGIGLSSSDIDLTATVDGTDYKTSVSNNTLLGIIIGYKFTSYAAIEFRGYGNVSEGDFLGYDVSVDHYFAVFGKAIIPVNDHIEVYGLVGAGKQQVSAFGISERDNDIAYGIGVKVTKHSPVDLQIEWVNTYDESFSGSSDVLGQYSVKIEQSCINLNLIFDF
ncbi:outer membrane beta-barrel protein [Vibrio parahaemolyticus]|uniref:outer membrane beta-barrel protein n=1 Tax=Vibrio TaxID=662 RepID=UPI001A8F7AA7|nr:porin family protein [Vibrio parahaemolyticus]MDF4578455.1 outer membrane beta-barrel protein [Vibrio parahaemolyticus]MDF5468268.1 outer membrane beta-barrel protein [Vibrio parahaemolyticus]MDF5501428.1 outer membrane beta-barrel protein [Vibrio parahaemolyticus]MDF5512176.1 outer membrane beta-barrel protein [Vibrio parahaemolyticus]